MGDELNWCLQEHHVACVSSCQVCVSGSLLCAWVDGAIWTVLLMGLCVLGNKKQERERERGDWWCHTSWGVCNGDMVCSPWQFPRRYWGHAPMHARKADEIHRRKGKPKDKVTCHMSSPSRDTFYMARLQWFLILSFPFTAICMSSEGCHDKFSKNIFKFEKFSRIFRRVFKL